MRSELVCKAADTPPRFDVRSVDLPRPGAGEVLVRVVATSVNPIDAKRAGGYGHRLLSLKGAARFPLVLGNDLAGRVLAVGPGVTRLVTGQRVFGLLATGRAGGAHATHVVVPENQLIAVDDLADAKDLAALPYSFVTMWLALRGIGLGPSSARQAKILINGADGGLGRLALQVLVPWGSRVTAICGRGQCRAALDLGAELAVDRGPGCIETLPTDFDAVLNFGGWDDDAALSSRLGPLALGQATTVHPLLANFDRLGWLGGAWASRRDWRAARARLRARAPQARYAWTVFKPDREALEALAQGLRERRIALPVGLALPLDQAQAAFEHVRTGRPGRAVLLP
jgi:NADPH:quinone reductase-like Zn-dependent oxidoreductase